MGQGRGFRHLRCRRPYAFGCLPYATDANRRGLRPAFWPACAQCGDRGSHEGRAPRRPRRVGQPCGSSGRSPCGRLAEPADSRRTTNAKPKGRIERATPDADLMAVLSLLVNDSALPERLLDHALAAEWKDHRDCHGLDLVLTYRVPDAEQLELVRLKVA